MDAEKNVVEAARKLTDAVYAEHFGSSYKRVLVDCLLVNKLQAALSAYDAARKDSAPAPSEDRVREAAKKAIRGFVINDIFEPSARAIDDVAAALKPYVTPAPSLPAGTVAVSVETLREIRRDAVSTHTMEGYPESSCSIAKTIDAILPPPKPEPPNELVAEWARKARAAAADLYISTKGQSADGFRSGYVAALRAAWEANGGA